MKYCILAIILVTGLCLPMIQDHIVKKLDDATPDGQYLKLSRDACVPAIRLENELINNREKTHDTANGEPILTPEGFYLVVERREVKLDGLKKDQILIGVYRSYGDAVAKKASLQQLNFLGQY